MSGLERFAMIRRLSALLPLAWLALGCAGGVVNGPRATWQGDSAIVVLEYKGDARSIFAVGDFNGWNPDSHPFIEGADGLWQCSLSLRPGRHAYLLAVETDSHLTWQPDLANPKRTRDGLGRELSLLVIGGAPDDDTGAP